MIHVKQFKLISVDPYKPVRRSWVNAVRQWRWERGVDAEVARLYIKLSNALGDVGLHVPVHHPRTLSYERTKLMCTLLVTDDSILCDKGTLFKIIQIL